MTDVHGVYAVCLNPVTGILTHGRKYITLSCRQLRALTGLARCGDGFLTSDMIMPGHPLESARNGCIQPIRYKLESIGVRWPHIMSVRVGNIGGFRLVPGFRIHLIEPAASVLPDPTLARPAGDQPALDVPPPNLPAAGLNEPRRPASFCGSGE